MGVPAFFRWLTVRYPQVVIDALSEEDLQYLQGEYHQEADHKTRGAGQAQQDGQQDSVDPAVLIQKKIRENNPEVHNLYLDMNGIIHPCCHPVDRPAPKTEAEMFNLIFEYVDRVVSIVQPSKTIYMAIDGVAPRAKMNQQRSRRFRTAIDAEEKAERMASIRNKWADEGIKFSDKPSRDGESSFDSNVITPGTEFMYNLARALQLYIVERIHSSPRWARLQVIFSDASIPGEGEHKILDFIRSQRASEGYDPNTSHCIYGGDADLIMLGLGTHEPHFYVLREALLQEKDKKCRRCHRTGHLTHECGTDQQNDPQKKKQQQLVQFQFVKLSVVREYLYLEFKDIKIPFAFDFERIVDDFIFLCFFVGNDFLPHLPSLSIREGALDALIFVYKNLLPSMGGYLTKGAGKLNFTNIDILLNDLAKLEEEFFLQHQRNAARYEERRKREEEREKATYDQNLSLKMKAKQQAGQNSDPVVWRNEDKRPKPASENVRSDHLSNGEETHASLDEITKYEQKKMTAAEFEAARRSQIVDAINKKEKLTEEERVELAAAQLKEVVNKHVQEEHNKKVEAYEDEVQFGKLGWKERYYALKFEVRGDEELRKFRRGIRQAYIEGLAWVFAYYYQGCVSWHWYYPYHYAPFASDLLGCDQLEIDFEQGLPVKPFEQLLSVFPKQSNHALPLCYRKLYEPDSPILGFYPSEVQLDINGARYAWMGVNLLPFIERVRLLEAMNEADNFEAKLTPHEKERNRQCGDLKLFFRKNINNKQGALLLSLVSTLEQKSSPDYFLEASFKNKDAVAGRIQVVGPSSDRNAFPWSSTIQKSMGAFQVDIKSNECHVVHLAHPQYSAHSTKLLEGVNMPSREVEDFAIYHIRRRVFQGEEAIQIVERVLNIDASRDPVYQFGGRTNYAGQQIGSYVNGRAVAPDSVFVPGGIHAARRPGMKRSYEQYSKQHPHESQHAGDRKRQHLEHSRAHPQQDRIDYNLNSRNNRSNYYADVASGLPNQAPQTAGGAQPMPSAQTGPQSVSQVRLNYQRQIEAANRQSQGQNQGKSSQLASLLSTFNEVSTPEQPQHQAGNPNAVLAQPQLQGANQFMQAMNQAVYHQHLNDQQGPNSNQRGNGQARGRGGSQHGQGRGRGHHQDSARR